MIARISRFLFDRRWLGLPPSAWVGLLCAVLPVVLVKLLLGHKVSVLTARALMYHIAALLLLLSALTSPLIAKVRKTHAVVHFALSTVGLLMVEVIHASIVFASNTHLFRFGPFLLTLGLIVLSVISLLVALPDSVIPYLRQRAFEKRSPRARVFICYRRSDSSSAAKRLYDDLASALGPDRVMRDVDSIPLGVDFRTYLRRVQQHCRVLFAVIGPAWASCVDAHGRRRLDDPDDYVRIELAAAFDRRIRVIAVVLQGGVVPVAEELPEDIKGLADAEIAYVRPDPDFVPDVASLLAKLRGSW